LNWQEHIRFYKGLGGHSILAISILITFISLILGFFFTNSQKVSLENELLKRSITLATNLAYNSQYWVLTEQKNHLQQLIQGVMNEEEVVYTYIINTNGLIIGHSEKTKIGHQIEHLNIDEVFDKQLSGSLNTISTIKEGIIEIVSPIEFQRIISTENEEQLFMQEAQPIQNPQPPTGDLSERRSELLGVVYLGVSTDKLNTAIAELKREAFFITFGIIIIGILVTVFLTRYVTHPLRKLMEATNIVAQGDLNHHVNIIRHDEIGILAQSFNRMIDDLKASREKIENWNKDLEGKVIERTKELSQKNIKLKKYSGELRKAYEELQTLDKAKDDFLALVSHELRTPLSSIVAYTEVLLDDMAETKEEENNYLEIIKNESDRLTRLINNVLDLSKMEAGRMPFDFKWVKLNALVNSSVQGLTGAADKKHQIIVNNLDNTPILVYADSDKVIQVFSNILSNAIKFSPEGGQIILDGTEKDQKIEVSIADNGCGISNKNVEKVFDKFQQIEDVDHHSEGTGLGMPISRIIVENHKGRIWFKSDFGKGTTFFFELPTKD